MDKNNNQERKKYQVKCQRPAEPEGQEKNEEKKAGPDFDDRILPGDIFPTISTFGAKQNER